MSLAYGLNTDTRPSEVGVAWGARLIWPNDLVWDRTSWDGDGSPEAFEQREALQAWLNGDALAHARTLLADMTRTGELRFDEHREVVLCDDGRGMIVANPNASYGYVYMAAWLYV